MTDFGKYVQVGSNQRRVIMGFMLEELKNNDEVEYLRVFNLETGRGWFQMLGAFFFFPMFVGAVVGCIFTGMAVVNGEEPYWNMAFFALCLACMIPAYLLVKAIKGKHLGKKTLLLMTLFLTPVGYYFLKLRHYDELKFKKHMKSKSDGSFVYNSN